MWRKFIGRRLQLSQKQVLFDKDLVKRTKYSSLLFFWSTLGSKIFKVFRDFTFVVLEGWPDKCLKNIDHTANVCYNFVRMVGINLRLPQPHFYDHFKGEINKKITLNILFPSVCRNWCTELQLKANHQCTLIYWEILRCSHHLLYVLGTLWL